MEQDTEVLVVGAGPAGLAAAAELSAQNYQVLVVEARERIGGRILTTRHPASPVPLDLGAEFIHGLAPRSWELIRREELPVFDVPDRHDLLRQGKRRDAEDFWSRVGQAIERAGSPLSHGRNLDVTLLEALSDCPLSREDKELALHFVEGFHAADPARISMRALIEETRNTEAIEGERAFRLLDGNIQLAHALIAGVGKVRCLHGSPVTVIRWEPGSAQVQIEVPSKETRLIQARAVVLTVPVGPLQCIVFDPPLPTEKTDAASRIISGGAIKVLIGFREPFWESRGSFDLGFLHSDEKDFPTWWSMLPFRTRFLAGWTGGPRAEELSKLSREELRDRALRTLSRIFKMRRSVLEGLAETFLYHDWINDPWSQGSYSYLSVGNTNAPLMLQKPVENTLFFAGEATESSGVTGTVEGAISSGIKAARALIMADHPRQARRRGVRRLKRSSGSTGGSSPGQAA